MKHRTEITFRVKNAHDARSFLDSLSKESEKGARFSSNISIRGQDIIIVIEAEDAVALRATVNSYLRYLQVLEGLGKIDE